GRDGRRGPREERRRGGGEGRGKRPQEAEEEGAWRRLGRHWRLILADFRRQYGITADQLYDLDTREFFALLGGLDPDRSVWVRVTSAEPVEVSGEAAQSLIHRL
ncbi:hypothetical protein ACFQ07_05280, partial [Actinomadura adrarensis]